MLLFSICLRTLTFSFQLASWLMCQLSMKHKVGFEATTGITQSVGRFTQKLATRAFPRVFISLPNIPISCPLLYLLSLPVQLYLCSLEPFCKAEQYSCLLCLHRALFETEGLMLNWALRSRFGWFHKICLHFISSLLLHCSTTIILLHTLRFNNLVSLNCYKKTCLASDNISVLHCFKLRRFYKD